jgi:hypothetical protein
MDMNKRNRIVRRIVNFICDVGTEEDVAVDEMLDCLKYAGAMLLYFESNEGQDRLLEIISKAAQSKEAN